MKIVNTEFFIEYCITPCNF